MGTTRDPKYHVDDRIGSFTVDYYCGHTNVGPDGREYRDAQHWYEVECECGDVETLSQSALAQRTQCKACSREKTRRADYGCLPPPGVPNFLTLRF